MYRDETKNLVDYWNMKTDYKNPVGYISDVLYILRDTITYSMYDCDIRLGDNANFADIIKNSFITIVEIDGSSGYYKDGFGTYSSSSFNINVYIDVDSDRDLYIVPIGATCSNDNISNTAYWLFPRLEMSSRNYASIQYRCRTATRASNTDIDNSRCRFLIFDRSWM